MDKYTQKIAIVIPTYNMADTICRTIDSCINQTVNAPIYVADDGSTDDTYKLILRKYGKRIKIYRRVRNRGLASIMNYVIQYIEEPYIILCAADDVIYPNTIKTWSNGNLLDVNYCRSKSIKPVEPEIILPYIKNRIKKGFDNITSAHQLYTNTGRHFTEGCGCMCLRTEMLRKERYDEKLRNKEGAELIIRLALSGYRFEYFDFVGGEKKGYGKSKIKSENNKAIKYIIEKYNDFNLS